ncbi:RagB/SusD family nutrient uptake outer membrane protein [Mangrovimonas sp. AS39]|uniref:RagB/SusD family nutrient uptake outer membrane protein n=1 Tax=Mangrovimonas futianensis TaxID=2895523 RepID=UPI001E3C36DB|nr:RagB/SusD family nutrient uptake outer membrane protein [Mangrovimonas futianensis]MCF1192320.1 RagB/SusD family nutrient uptake outer membrane protein [Mangrovimonas futianensis]MCF1195931.1 RagB/SusD family nutrient uptake outer membrane protein [Mangrovimonas futianensis]
MKSLKVKYITLILMGMTFVVSCEKDFLEREPLSAVTPEQYLNDESQLAAYAIERYNMFPTHAQWSFGTFGIDVHTDNMATFGYDNKFVPGQWRVGQSGGSWWFDNIRQCNYFLETVLPKWEAGEITGSPQNIEHYIGEMYFFRAYDYFTRVQLLGDFPIITETFPDDMEVLTEASKRQPRSEVVRFILSDLDMAISLMSSSSPDGGKNRLNKACAQLFKSRVALYEGTWLKYFAGTPFVPNGPGWPGAEMDYNQGYQYQTGSIEAEIQWLFEQSMEASSQVANSYSLESNNGVLQQSIDDPSNPYFDMFSAVDMSGFSEVLLYRRYDGGLSITHNVPVYAQLGNNGVGLTRGLVESFLMENGLPIYASGSGYQGDDYISDVRANRDGRLWLFLKEPEQINVLFNTNAGSHITPVEPVPNITNTNLEQGYSTGYAIRKGLNYDGAQCNNGGGYTGALVFRATEAYLNYIEACYEKNGSLDGTASTYWSAIRNRAGVDSNYQLSISNTQMTIEAQNDWGAYSAGQLIDPTLYNIRRERRCELMAEGLRWMDLKRWRAMDQMISEPYHIEGFKLWGPMQDWYTPSSLTYGTPSARVSSPDLSDYLRPYEKTGNELVFNGYEWTMAHYLEPIAAEHFLITGGPTSVIYQNPGWSTSPNSAPTDL